MHGLVACIHPLDVGVMVLSIKGLLDMNGLGDCIHPLEVKAMVLTTKGLLDMNDLGVHLRMTRSVFPIRKR